MQVKANFQKSTKKENSDDITCFLCPHQCTISPDNRGICQVRKNIDGILYSLNYAEITSAGLDPVEKKPLYHFYPGSEILSLGTFGCNFSCDFCQNWQISQKKPQTKILKPEEVIELARKKSVEAIAFTYSEPIVWYEYVLETAKLAQEEGFKSVLVTNGFINNKPLQKLLPYIDAANVDLKSFNNDFYKKYTGGQVEPVKETIKMIEERIHLEITILIINELNDSIKEMEELFSWISNINSSIPIHLSRYFPAYKMDKPATNIKSMKKAYEIASKYLEFVYLGNMRDEDKRTTYCPECGEKIISRNLYQTRSKIERGKCPECETKIYGKFE